MINTKQIQKQIEKSIETELKYIQKNQDTTKNEVLEEFLNKYKRSFGENIYSARELLLNEKTHSKGSEIVLYHMQQARNQMEMEYDLTE